MLAIMVVELITVTGVSGVVPLNAVEAEVKFVPVMVTVTADAFPAGAPGGQIPLDAAMVGMPALTVNVTLTTTLLFAAFVEDTVIVPLYGVRDGASPVASAVTLTVWGRPITAILPVGDALSHVPPATATEAVSASPLLAINKPEVCAAGPVPVV
jgi:hypothetical protein